MPERWRRPAPWLSGAARAYVLHLPLVLGVAIAIGVPSALISLISDRLPGVVIGDGPSPGRLVGAALLLIAVAAGSLGATVLAGALDSVMQEVAEEHLGRRARRPVLHVLARLPLLRLVAADILVTTVTVIGFVLFVLPGLLAIPLLALTGPLVTIERLGPLAAMRRSVTLARRGLVSVVVALVVPVALVWVLDGLVSQEGIPAALRIGGTFAVAILVAPYAALVKVLAAHGLRDRERIRRA